jgi:hypothetical protein
MSPKVIYTLSRDIIARETERQRDRETDAVHKFIYKWESIQQKEMSDFIQWQQTCLKLDQSTLIRFFREEFSQVVELWNTGKIRGNHFDKSSFLVGRIENLELRERYKCLITQWNVGKVTIHDFTPLRIYNAQYATSCSLISADRVGDLNVQRCKYVVELFYTLDQITFQITNLI